ncbi:MAG: response regulator transcription factor [Alphaproteobacteria bacterium]|nr:response regulator transcription factor [Alphaproteobacteria bacterium]
MTKCILIIDDDKVLRNTLAVSLRKVGFDTLTAQSAEDGLEILNRVSVDAIVLDRMMEGMDGLSFLKQIRTTNNDTPVIMLTALSGAENAIDGLSGGADDYMAKPFQFQELILRLNNVMKNRRTPTNTSNDSIGLVFTNNDFFIVDDNQQKKLLSLSNEEKKLLQKLTTPVGNIATATPMVAKRLRNKIKGVLSYIDIITVRGMGYKIIKTKGEI